MRINNNMMAQNTHRQLGMATNRGAQSMEKLSSGMRINRAGDDAAGLSISEKMRGQIRGLNQASRNAQDGISLIQTAEGALNESHAILQRMRELTVQSGNEGTLASEDVAAIADEITELLEELDDISTRTQFNGKDLLDGGFSEDFQIGANADQQLTLTINAGTASSGFNPDGLGIDSLSIASFDAEDDIDGNLNFDSDIGAIEDAIKKVSAARSNLGANQNRLEHTIANLDNAAENLQAAESRIRDVDMAQEMMEHTKQNILQQASTAMLAQANMAPQNVLQLLG
ncbi:flagellin Hag [Proteinivorax hydrogeniformans]|uniref:Flagellin n=1 Tax=Proteinivorax hydrogeniformans TaxID=1826727 RepID=A0AAU8HUW5_9FIRM